MSARSLPLVAIVGRPNVGKSTLLNRFVGRRDAIVEEQPGVTRDRKYAETEWLGRRFVVVDTGGWLVTDEPLARQISQQAERAIEEADVIVMVVDVTIGVTDEDSHVARLLQRSTKPVHVVANKADHPNRDIDAWAFSALGLGDPIAMSAMHGRFADMLLDAIIADFPEDAGELDDPGRGGPESDGPAVDGALGDRPHGDRALGDDRSIDDGDDRVHGDDDDDEAADRTFSVAIAGRPNVGKSTLFNRLVGDDRAIVHDLPGTTRDSVDTVIETDDGALRIIDTAGIRRRSRIEEGVEWFSLVRALKAVDKADACLFVIDSTQGVTHQDQRLAERIDGAGCAIVVLLNKWELLDAEARERIIRDVDDRLGFVGYAPVLRISALTGRNVGRIIPAVQQAKAEYRRRVPTGTLNRVIQEAMQRQPPPVDRGKRPRIMYATQGATDPPTFTLFASAELPRTYLRYLERMIRESFAFGPTPIKLRVRRRSS